MGCGRGGGKEEEGDGELRGFQSRSRFSLLTSDFPQLLKPSASDGRRNEEAPPSPRTCCPSSGGGDVCFLQAAKAWARGEPSAGTGRAGFCAAWGQALSSLSLVFLIREIGAKIPVEHS